MLVGSIAKHAFGSEIAKLHPTIYAVLSQRLSLLIMGMEVEKHFPKQYGKDVSLQSALGDASNHKGLDPAADGACAGTGS